MNDNFIQGKPRWLSAYPNEGTKDYFGYRFYRQPLRALLVRGAAANNFKNPKSLIYFAAFTYAFRKNNNIKPEIALSNHQATLWNQWHKVANYLFVINYYAEYKNVPDAGFTGANEEFHIHFRGFHQAKAGQYDINATFDRFYPDQRKWGYLTQFWLPPLKYFRCVLDVVNCVSGEYAKDCYDLLSSYTSWDVFIKVLMSGKIDRAELHSIQQIIDCKDLSIEEQALARRMIFDGEDVTEGENDNYKESYRLLEKLNKEGLEGFIPQKNEDYATIFSYAHLKNIPIGKNDLAWKILLSSLYFEIGLNRLFSFLSNVSSDRVIEEFLLEKNITESISNWLIKTGFSGTLTDVMAQWRAMNLKDISAYKDLSARMFDGEDLESFIDGLLQGYMISQVKLSMEEKQSEHYLRLTDEYHYFAPQPFFKNTKEIENKPFDVFIIETINRIINEQFDFSLVRMNMGQKAKFILMKSEFKNEYIFQVDAEKFKENRGIIDMIDATLCLWKSAGAF